MRAPERRRSRENVCISGPYHQLAAVPATPLMSGRERSHGAVAELLSDADLV